MPKIVWSLLLLSCTSAQIKPTRFSAIQLASRVINDLPHDNVLVCPPAISLALSQLYLAAGGETETELAKVLGYTGTTKDGVLKDFERLKSLTAKANPRVQIASRLFTKGIKMKPGFQKMAKEYSNIDTDNMEVSPDGVAKINQWITSNTDRSLDELIDPLMLEDSMKAFMVTAITFSGLWKFKFRPIADGSFYVPDEKQSVPVKMMQVVGTFNYDFQRIIDGHVVILPFANSTLSMTLMVPRSYLNIQTIEDNLLRVNMAPTVRRTVRLSLPQFQFRYSLDVIQALIDLGVNRNVFEQADLSALTAFKGTVKTDSILHSAFIKIDDQGSQAAFATGNDGLARAVPAGVVDIVVNRPFIFSISDGPRILFFGRYSHPV